MNSAEGSAAVGFRGKQACSIVGITYRQLDYWARTDLIRPSIADASGSGSQRLYSYLDLISLKIIKSLLDAGISLQLARRAVEYLHTHLGNDLPSAHLVLDGTNVFLKRDEELIDLIRSGQRVLNVIPLQSMVDSIDAAIPLRIDLATTTTHPEQPAIAIG